jgi:hypothetical protein
MFDLAGGYLRQTRTVGRQAIAARYEKIVAEAARQMPELDNDIIDPARGDTP